MPRYANGYAIRYILSCKEEGKGINKKVGRDCVDVYHNVRLNGKKTKQNKSKICFQCLTILKDFLSKQFLVYRTLFGSKVSVAREASSSFAC